MTERVRFEPRLYKLLDHVVGLRYGSKAHYMDGILVDCYYTINRKHGMEWENAAYVVKCFEDGKERSFQSIAKFKPEFRDLRAAWMRRYPEYKKEYDTRRRVVNEKASDEVSAA